MDHSIRIATASDADRIAEIYNHYIANTVVTFEEELVAGDEMCRLYDELFRRLMSAIGSESCEHAG